MKREVRQEARPRERGGRDGALRGWENWAVFYVYLNLWTKLGIVICIFILGSQ